MTHDPLCPNATGCPHDCGGCSCNLDAFCQCDIITHVRNDTMKEFKKAADDLIYEAVDFYNTTYVELDLVYKSLQEAVGKMLWKKLY